MNIFLRSLKLSFSAILYTGTIAHAAGNGGGLGGFVGTEQIGGSGGGADFVGGVGGALVGLPASTAPAGDNGGVGVSSPNNLGVGGVGGTSVIINNESDPLPARASGNTRNPWDAPIFTFATGSGGGGGGVGAIINAANYTISQKVLGGQGAYGSGICACPLNLGPRGSGGGGTGIVFNGQVLNITKDALISGGAGGTSRDYPLGAASEIQGVVNGGGGLGLLINSGTVNNAGTILGGHGYAVQDPSNASYASQGGSAVYMKSNTVLNNSGTIQNSRTANTAMNKTSAIIASGDGSVIYNKSDGMVISEDQQQSAGFDDLIYIEGNSNTFIQEGKIVGGYSVVPGQPYSKESDNIALSMTGDNNKLELRGGNKLDGLVRSTGGKNHLVFGGDTNDSFDLSRIGPEGATVQYTGFADYRKTGNSKWTMSGTQGDTGPWTVDAGILSVLGNITGTMHATGGRLEGTGSVGSLTHEIGAIVAPGVGDFGVLTVNGDYIGKGGTVEITSILGGDNSPTSRLVITEDTSGTGNVHVINQGGVGALTQNGIKIIDVGGRSNGTFSLLGDFTTEDNKQAVIAGAFAYTLEQKKSGSSAGDWFLTSNRNFNPDPDPTDPTNPNNDDPDPVNPHNDDPNNPIPDPDPNRYHPGAPVYESAVQNMQSLNTLPTLQQRVGNRYWSKAGNPVISQGDGPGLTDYVPSPEAGVYIESNTVWARIGGAYTRLDPELNRTRAAQKIDTSFIQIGIDGQFYETEGGKLIGGMTGLYGRSKTKVDSDHGDGDTTSDAWGLGGTLTWYGETGFYVDSQAQVLWFNNDLNSATLNRELAQGINATGYALGMETGWRYDLNDRWSLTPQAQLTWSTLSMDSFRDVWDTKVSLKDGNNLTGRLGISADYRNAWYGNDGRIVRMNMYSIANLYYSFIDKLTTRIAEEEFSVDNDNLWGGIGYGGTYSWADDRYSIYGEGSLNTSLQNFGNSYSVAGTVGFKVKW